MKIRRQSQLPGHCGPTCMSMLLDYYGYSVSPTEIVRAANLSDSIQAYGSRVDQLADAVRILYPKYVVLGRFYCNVELLARLVNDFSLPVVVEWQGQFYREASGREKFDIGHYALVTGVDLSNSIIQIIDPDDASVFAHGEISVDEFQVRWWEDNLMQDRKYWRTFRLIFLLVPKSSELRYTQLGFEECTYRWLLSSSTESNNRKTT